MVVRSGVYVITNTNDDKVYVGSSAHIPKRWTSHRNSLKRGKHHCRHLQGAVARDGIAAFRFEVVEIVEDLLFLEAREQFWIWRLKAADERFGYNTAPAAGSILGIVRSLDVREKVSRAKKGRPLTEAHKQALREAWARNPARREAFRATMASFVAKTRHGPEWRASMDRKRGRPFTAEHRAAISAAALGKKKSPEHVANMRAAITGRTLSAAHRAAISLGQRRRS